jgi:predicted amidophosphoribosyltransferase
MPKCCNCAAEKPTLYSINRIGKDGKPVSEALCPVCLGREADKQKIRVFTDERGPLPNDQRL